MVFLRPSATLHTMLHKYKLSKRDYLSLYPLVSPERIVNDFGADRCVTPRRIRQHYSDEKLESPMKARKTLINLIVNGSIVFDRDSWLPVDAWMYEAEERIEKEYRNIKERIMKDVQLYEERNVCN